MEFFYNTTSDVKEWNAFVAENGGSFLQSYEWGEFQKKAGRGVVRAGVREQGELTACAAVFAYDLPFQKRYWYVPFGPVVSSENGGGQARTAFLFRELPKKVLPNVVFLKVEPDRIFADGDLASLGFQKSSKTVQTPETLIADLTLSEDALLARMKQKTRYNIKLAARHGVKIIGVEGKESLDPEIFLSLMKETAVRNRFRLHPAEYYRAMTDALVGAEPKREAQTCSAKFFFAQYEGKIVSCALVAFFGARATYLHGASSDEYKNIMAPYLLHWEIMRYAKSRGFSEYDFWGIVTERTDKKNRQKWEGFSRFKEGFGGNVAEYPGAYDLVFSKVWYNAYRMARKFPILN